MKIFVSQHSNLPYIEISLTSILEKYKLTSDDFENSVATFSMYDVKRNQFIIANEEAEIYAKKRVIIIDEENNYFVRYKLSTDQTQFIGDFIGEFKINFLNNNCGTLTVPMNDKLNIIIKKSITKTLLSNDNNIIPTNPLVPSPTWYYGTYEVLGGVVNIPNGSVINLSNGTLVNNFNPNNDLNILFNSSSNDFVWFAIPIIVSNKNRWILNQYNFGDIGGIKNINGNLFPDPEIITFNNMNYKLYISNYRVTIPTIKILK